MWERLGLDLDVVFCLRGASGWSPQGWTHRGDDSHVIPWACSSFLEAQVFLFHFLI